MKWHPSSNVCRSVLLAAACVCSIALARTVLPQFLVGHDHVVALWIQRTTAAAAMDLPWRSGLRPWRWATNPRRQTDVLSGVTVSRTVSLYPAAGNFTILVDDDNDNSYPPSSYCSQRDDYGDNDCHWDWNASVAATVSVLFDRPIQADDYLEGHVKVCTQHATQRVSIPYNVAVKLECQLAHGPSCTIIMITRLTDSFPIIFDVRSVVPTTAIAT